MRHSLGFESFEQIFGDVTDTISEGLRGKLIAREGKKFVGGDLAQMEARVLAWLVDDDHKLEMYRNGIDVYSVLAASIYGYEVKKGMPERQVGKVADLSLGYGGGIGAFAGMAKNYGLDLETMGNLIWKTATAMEKEEALTGYNRFKRTAEEPVSSVSGLGADVVKQRWRLAHPKAVKFWSDLDEAVARAVITKKAVRLEKLKFFVHDQFLFIMLPSGKCIAYLKPVVKSGNGRFEISYVNSRYGRRSHWGGQWCENVVQATQREILVDCMFRLEDNGFDIVYHNYDECASEVPLESDCEKEYGDIMRVCPVWAEGLPINVETWQGVRYGK